MSSSKIIFVTGTDTGVGKTVLTALLLHHLRSAGVHALATKPFCSGGLADVRLLQSLQAGELPDAEMNPFYFPQPLAPLVAVRPGRKPVQLRDAVSKIRTVARKCDCLLVEGSGGLLVPLGPGYTVADLIARLNCHVLVAARNRLGTINHTLLTIDALLSRGMSAKNMGVVLMATAMADLSSRTNHFTLQKLLRPITVFSIPKLGKRASSTAAITQINAKVRSELRSLSQALGVANRERH